MPKDKLVSSPAVIPPYQKEFYSRIYENKFITKLLDRQWLLDCLTLGNNRRLAKACLEEIQPNQQVLQLGGTFGNQLPLLAKKLGVYGKVDIVDVSITQLRYLRNKYRFSFPSMGFINCDALQMPEKKYDVVICYMLLHEMPTPTKSKLVNNVLSSLAPGGKAVFIDYNNAVWWHPLRWIVKMFNRLYQPFAERMWKTEIREYAVNKSLYDWHKTTYFGKMYQKLVVIKKIGLY